MNEEKRKKLITECNDRISYLEGNAKAKSAVQKQVIKEICFGFPLYILVLALISIFLLICTSKEINIENYLNMFKVIMMFFFIPVLIGYVFVYIFPIYNSEEGIYIGLAWLILDFISYKLFKSKEAAFVISSLLLLLILQNYSKVIVKNRIDKLKEELNRLENDIKEN